MFASFRLSIRRKALNNSGQTPFRTTTLSLSSGLSRGNIMDEVFKAVQGEKRFEM